MENDENIQDGQEEKYTELTPRNKVFCQAFVMCRDKYKAYEMARYEAKDKDAKAACISRMLRNPRVQEYIQKLEDEQAVALCLSNERIIGNLCQIAFDEEKTDNSRLRALEILAKSRGMLKDVSVEAEQDELSQERIAQAKEAARQSAEAEWQRIIGDR